ncbi:MAG: PD-(D/E)XK nuclease family protein, partial [Campylobacterota bacterium]|nr:PD-(D/E)XK nuclease family protein [Campylobacterota bacterium]
FSTSRAIRKHLFDAKKSDSFLSKTITIGELFKKSILIDDRVNIDSDKRTLLLLEATNFEKFASLQIERNFFTFLNNSKYIFTFYEELSTELVSIDELKLIDVYSEYEEHIEILHYAYKEYVKLLDKHNYSDKIVEPYISKLNIGYVKSFDEITLHVDGYLSRYELRVLEDISQHTMLTIHYNSTPYNKKMSNNFLNIGIEIPKSSHVEFNLSSKTITTCSASNYKPNVEVYSFNQRLLQVAFVKHSIAKMVQSGINAQDIVVIVPDEMFAPTLKNFDTENNLNFAMGLPINRSFFIRAIDAYVEFMGEQSVKNADRLSNYDEELFKTISNSYFESVDSICFTDALSKLLNSETNESVKTIVKEELFYFAKLIDELENMKFKELLHIFLKRLKSRTIDDVGGGKVTVMGLLESRGIYYDGVIIVDFNSTYVPRKSQKDMFLNSSMKKAILLPTSQDRQNLQKHYYYELINGASQARISYVHNEQNSPSIFLSQLRLDDVKRADEDEYAQILFEKHRDSGSHNRNIEFEYELKSLTLSATSLKSFLECKREFYYKYILKIASHVIKDEIPQEYEIGSLIHNALQKVYIKAKSFNSENILKNEIMRELFHECKDNILQKFQLKLWEKKLDAFVKNEIERFKSGVSVLHVEQSYSSKFCGFKISGRVDRVDVLDSRVQVLDYKSGNYKLYTQKTLLNASDFQLEFYYLLLKENYEVEFCGFYDLNSGKIVKESIMSEKLERLKEILNEFSTPQLINFEMCENLQKCSFCSYSKMCGRA